MGLSKADPHVRVLRLPSLTLASRSMATAQVAPSQPMKKAGYEPEQTFHRIRITLTSRNVANLACVRRADQGRQGVQTQGQGPGPHADQDFAHHDAQVALRR